MKTKTIKNGCGGKKGTRCNVSITLPYGIAPERKADNSAMQGQASN